MEDEHIRQYEVHDIRYKHKKKILRVVHLRDKGGFWVEATKERRTLPDSYPIYQDSPCLDPDDNPPPDEASSLPGHLCGGGQLIAHRQSKNSNVVALYKSNSPNKPIWSLDWDGEDNKSVHRHRNWFFLVTQSSLTMICREYDEVVEKIIYGFPRGRFDRLKKKAQGGRRKKGGQSFELE